MVAAAAASFSIIVEGWVGIPDVRGLASLVVVAMMAKLEGWVEIWAAAASKMGWL
jgi:hypothetical protein